MSVGLDHPIGPVPFVPGGGPGSPVPEAIRRQRPDLKREYVATGTSYSATTVPLALPASVDDVDRERGARHYEWMMTDPVVSSSVRALKLAILAGGMDLKATISARPGAKQPSPDEKLAQELVDFCWRCVERCKGWNPFLMGLLDATAFGNRMAEKTFEVSASGPDAGKLVWKSIKVKPRDAWQFVVDDTMNVLGILYRKPGSGGTREFLPREKVVILTWDAHDADPRGSSVLRPAADVHNLKNQVWPQLYKHLCQFGSASLVGKTAPGEVDRQPVDPLTGLPDTSALPISPQQFMASQMVEFQNGSVLVVPFGAEVMPIQPQGDGAAFHSAIETLDRQIVHAILLSPRATLEAVHNSKADSETAQDFFGLLVESGRQALSGALRDDCFRQIVALNYGQEVADEFTPLVTFGTEQQDRPAEWGAVAGLMSSGYLGASQMEELDSMMGLPIRDIAADEAKAKEAMEAQSAMQPKPGASGQDDEDQTDEREDTDG
jgi:hypothetical protein